MPAIAAAWAASGSELTSAPRYPGAAHSASSLVAGSCVARGMALLVEGWNQRREGAPARAPLAGHLCSSAGREHGDGSSALMAEASCRLVLSVTGWRPGTIAEERGGARRWDGEIHK